MIKMNNYKSIEIYDEDSFNYKDLLDSVTLYYEDIDVPVVLKLYNVSIYGHIFEWDYEVNPEIDDIINFLNKNEIITQEDIDNINREDFESYLYFKYMDDALLDAKNNYDINNVSWDFNETEENN